MAETTKLYTGIINEFVDWVTGMDTDSMTHVDPEEGKQISGESIRKLLQNRLLKPIYNYNGTKKQIIFPSEEIAQRWQNAGVDNASNKYNKYILVELPKPNTYKFQYKAQLRTADGNIIPVERGGIYYILKQNTSVDLEIEQSYRTVQADNETEWYSENYAFTYYISDINNITKSFTHKRQGGTATSVFNSDAIGSYLKSGENHIMVKMTGEGNKNANTPSSGLTDVTVMEFTVNVVEMELQVIFEDTPMPSKFNINRPIYTNDENLTAENPQISISYNLQKTISGTNNKVYFDVFIDADIPNTQSALILNDESYNVGDHTASNSHLVENILPEPSFKFEMGNNDSTITISKETQGAGNASVFLARLRNSAYSGQHSCQLYAYIKIGEEKFYSNTVYFTFNIASSNIQTLYANIYYHNNKYPSPYYSDFTDRYIICNQYQDVNISWAISSLNTNNREIEWHLEYPGFEGYGQKLTTQTVAPYTKGSSGTLLTGNKGIQFVPIYTITGWLRGYCNEKLGENRIVQKKVFEIPIKSNPASFQMEEAKGYMFKLSAYSKSNSAADKEEWIPVDDQGIVPNISTGSDEKAYTEFTNVNFDSESTGWINHGLSIYGLNSYATIYYDAIEMQSLNAQGHTVEIEFETTRVQSDNDVLIKIGTGLSSEGGIIITPTKAYIAKNGEATAALTNYKINERMRIAFIYNMFNDGAYTFDKTHPDNNLLFIVNNGILERAATMEGAKQDYASSTGYIQIGNKNGDMQIPDNSGNVYLGKGSGIIVYNIKIYNTALTYNAALQNYMLGASNKADIINRNRILNFDNGVLSYQDCCGYVPTFLITGDLTKILNKNKSGDKAGKKDSESNVNIVYTNPYDPTRNFSVNNCQIRKHGQSTLTYPITSMKFWLNKVQGDETIKPEFIWNYQNEEVESNDKLAKNRYIMKRNSFVDDNNLFADLAGKPSIPANKFVLQANYADSSGVHNGAIERLIQLTWLKAVVNNIFVLRTPPQLFTTNQLNSHNYQHIVYEYTFEEDPKDPTKMITVATPVDYIKIEAYTIDQAYGPESFWKIFTGPPATVSAQTWQDAYALIKNLTPNELIGISQDTYNKFTEEQQDIIDAELSYIGYGKLHSSNPRYYEFANIPNHVAGHLQWQDYFPADVENNNPRKFPYHIGVSADSLPCAVFYQSTTSQEADQTVQFLGQYVFMEDKKSEECFGEGAIYSGKKGNDYSDPFCFTEKAQKDVNFDNKGNKEKQNSKKYRLWNNKRVLRIECLNIDTAFTSFLESTEPAIHVTQQSDEKVACQFDDIIRTPKDDKGQFTVSLCWEQDFELIYPDPDDIAEDQIEENEERVKNNLNPINNYYEQGSVFRKTTQPWVDFFTWAVSTTGDIQLFKETAAMHLDLWKMAAYYIYFLRFGLVDSVERNAQWKTYDGLHWHCEPWDMDIALGNNNQGQITFRPPLTRTTQLGNGSYAYSGSAKQYGTLRGNWIWNALESWSEWYNDILPAVAAALTKAGLTYDNINYMFDKEYVYKWSESIYNLGGHFKYIETLTPEDVSKLSWLQGSRETHRHWWLYESMTYYDSVWKCGDYTSKKIQFYTDKQQNVPGWADITTNKDCLITSILNDDSGDAIFVIGSTQALQGVSTGSAVTFTDYSLSNKVPLTLWGSMFFEKFDITSVAAGLYRIDLSGANSNISGGTLYELKIGASNTRTGSNNKYTFPKYNVFPVIIEGGHFDHLQTYNIEGQVGLDFAKANIGSMKALENLYAKASGLKSATFKDLNFTNLELPATTQTTSGTIVFTELSFDNVSWKNLSFWTSTLSQQNTQMVSTRYNNTITIGNDIIQGTIPITISTIEFTGSTAKKPEAKDLVYKWLWGKYQKATNGSVSANIDTLLQQEFATSKLTLHNIDWSTETGLQAEYDNENPDAILLLSYWDLKLMHYTNINLSGYILIGDASKTIGTRLTGANNKLDSGQMRELQLWFGDTIFTQGAKLQISHVNSYISLSIITNPLANGTSFNQNSQVYLKETELGAAGYITVNATKFGSRNDNTVFDWKIQYQSEEGSDQWDSTTSNPTFAPNKSIHILYENDYHNLLRVHATESTINTTIDALGERVFAYPIILKCYPHGQEDDATTTTFSVLPKIWPEAVRITSADALTSPYVTNYTGMNILGIRNNVTITIDTQGYFSSYPDEWYSIIADGDVKVGEGEQERQKYKFNELDTFGTGTTQGVITFHTIKYNLGDAANNGSIYTLNNASKNWQAFEALSFIGSGSTKPTVEYKINEIGQLVLKFSDLKDQVFDFNLSAYLNYECTGDITVNNQVASELNNVFIKIRTLKDTDKILTSSTTNTYDCIAAALTVPLQATPAGELYKMDLYLLDGTLDFSKQQYRKNLKSTLSDRINYYDSIFLYLPNITSVNLSNTNVQSQTSIQGLARNSFDFSNCRSLQTLNMQDMPQTVNTIPINISNCTKLESVISENSSITFDYPSNINSLTTVKIGNPLYIILKNLQGLTTLGAPTNNDCEHIHFENLKLNNTFTYFSKVYKNLYK